jgi:hypothetical protein
MGTRANKADRIAFETIPIEHPVSRFHKFWHDNLDAEGFYNRSSFNPMRLPSLIPWMTILDAPEETGGSFTYRLCGTGFTELTGVEMTGKTVGDGMLPDYAKILIKELQTCIADNEPKYSKLHVPIEGREFISVLRGAFPVRGTSGRIDQVLVIVGREDQKVDPLK